VRIPSIAAFTSLPPQRQAAVPLVAEAEREAPPPEQDRLFAKSLYICVLLVYNATPVRHLPRSGVKIGKSAKLHLAFLITPRDLHCTSLFPLGK